jgi:hypothetical protein
MTLYEWKITDLSNGRFGYLWIELHQHDDQCRQRRCGTSQYLPRVIIDANDLYGDFEYWSTVDGGNNLANLHIPEDWKNRYGRILAYWHNKGCPVIDRKSPGYEAPWFPWREAEFTAEERDFCIHNRWFPCIPPAQSIGGSDSEAEFEKAAEFMEAE